MITVEYGDLLLTVLTICAVVLTVAIASIALRVRRAISRLDAPVAKLDHLLPELERLAQEAGPTLRSLRALSESAGAVVDDVGTVTTRTREAALPLIRELSSSVEATQEVLRHLSAFAVGAKVGLSALHRIRSDGTDH